MKCRNPKWASLINSLDIRRRLLHEAKQRQSRQQVISTWNGWQKQAASCGIAYNRKVTELNDLRSMMASVSKNRPSGIASLDDLLWIRTGSDGHRERVSTVADIAIPRIPASVCAITVNQWKGTP